MRRWVQAGIVSTAVGAAVVPMAPTSVERWYSTGFYPGLQRVLTPVSNLVPFAWLDVLTVGAAMAMVIVLARAARTSRRRRRLSPVLLALGQLATAGALGYLVFLGVWGLNYRRVPMMERLVLDRAAPGTAEVLALGRTAVDQLNALHAPAHAAGWQRAPWESERLREEFAAVQRLLADAPLAVPGRLKSSLYGPYFRWTGVDGMVNPFGLEVIGNPDLLPFERPFVAGHEWAHLAGYADEAEASFVGWLTCVRGDAQSAYSGWLFLYWQLRSEVSASDRQHLAERLLEGPAADVEAIAARLRRGQVPRLRTASWQVYDGYLKANRVEQGIASYGAVVTLVLRVRFEEGWTPVRQ